MQKRNAKMEKEIRIEQKEMSESSPTSNQTELTYNKRDPQ